MAKVTWDNRTLYEKATVGTCAITGAYETGRFFTRDGERIFVGDSAQPEVVEDFMTFKTARGTVDHFKRGYPKKDWIAERVAIMNPPKKKR